MSNRLRRILAVTVATLMFQAAIGSSAIAQSVVDQGDTAHAPAAVDVLLLRPAGFISLIVGTALFTVAAPIVLISRPHEIGVPFKQLVVRPAKYIWVDPIGHH